jgi:hypothetical protein
MRRISDDHQRWLVNHSLTSRPGHATTQQVFELDVFGKTETVSPPPRIALVADADG